MENRNTQKPRSRKILFLIVAILIFLLFFGMLHQGPWSGFSTRSAAGTTGYQENPWVLSLQDAVLDSQVQLPEYLKLESGKQYTLSTVLTYDGSKDEMPYGFLHLDHVYCRVILDGEVLFSCMPEDVQRWDRARSPGFIYKAFPLPKDCMGKEMKIELLPMLATSIEYGLPDIEFGDFTTALHRAVLKDAPHDVMTVLCALLGFAAILFSAAALRDSDFREGISIGIFSLLFSLYLLTECRLNTFYIGNPYYTYLLNYIPFSLLPISLMGFMRERLLEKHRKICTAMIAAELVMFLLEMVFHFCGILDMRDVIPAIHVLYFANITLVVILIQAMKDKKRKHSLVLQITPVIVGMCADAVIYWMHWDVGSNDATFTIVGVLLFLVIEILHVCRTSISIYTESVRSSLYRQMAYVDELTGAGNRRAYDNEIERIVSGEKTYESMIVISADVNKLKYVNDHYGHAAGDNLIRSSAQIMAEVVGDRGLLFRTGGDEFSVFLYDTEVEELERMRKDARKKIEQFNARNRYVLSLAMGYVQIRNDRILDAANEADQKMYEDKAKYNADSV